ncbi:ribose transport system substrate-binding protein [Actinoplanes octamycinicus]|uniref:Ribose transport system substrate-binding protein n=1 Tax=Actinoplanes octamycinicus TaxID=135948 RepID=A0A7W7M9I1_9ACTN|nr:substrate-binding domain-containing protein [Actinoplanes octamycinicus]MBB4741886.1 ribose transport system substrate-binding protein [Actinoplanes octamycinicus]GIE60649.1 LacI family transcriptional regulator [Actinoplanes octamycinicus]
MSRISVHRGVAAAVSAAALVLVAACGSGGSSSSDGTLKVAAVIKGLDNPFFQSMEQGIKDQAQTSGTEVTVQAANSITDTTGQADKLTGLAGQDYSCYIVNPISGTNLIQGMAQLAAQKKTIVNIDSPVDAAAAKAANATPATYIGTNNVSAGEQGGRQMLTLLPGGGKVAAIGGIAGDVTSGQRIEGFGKAITGKLDLVQTVAANWERQEALTQATNIMRAQPDLKGFFVANDDMGLGVARAVATAGKAGQIKVISVDGIKDALTAVKNGELDATVAQYPYAIGAMGMEACQAAAKGATLPATVEAPVEVVTKANADQALAATPKPFGTYDDPFKTLSGS